VQLYKLVLVKKKTFSDRGGTGDYYFTLQKYGSEKNDCEKENTIFD
jgi:hypothetical protein